MILRGPWFLVFCSMLAMIQACRRGDCIIGTFAIVLALIAGVFYAEYLEEE